MYIHDSQSRIVAVRSFHGVDFNHNIQRFFSTSRFIDNKKMLDHGVTKMSKAIRGETVLAKKED